MAKNNSNNRRGEDRSIMSSWSDTAKDKPFATAAAAAGAVAAGVFLWSRRNQITDQISRLSNQITDWADEMRSGGTNAEEFAIAGDTGTFDESIGSASGGGRSGGSRGKSGGGSRRGMSTTGGGNASLGAHTGTTGSGAGGGNGGASV